MALATICPHCSTTFRVASDQLKLRGGIVRCGACNEVFDGSAALVDLDAAPQGALPAADAEADVGALPVLHSVVSTPPAPTAPAEAATYIIDFDTTLAPAAPAPAPPAAATEPLIEEYLVALPPPDDDGLDAIATTPTITGAEAGPAPAPAPARPRSAALDSLAPLLMRASAGAEDRPGPATLVQPGLARRDGAARKKTPELKPPPPSPAAVVDDEPEFVRSGRRREETGATRRRLMAAGVALLVALLLLQGVWSFRNVLAARYPAARPLLGAVCTLLGCKVTLPAQIDALSVETGELQSLEATADGGTFSFTTLLRNQGDLVQAWPHLELALTDASDKTLVRRVFAPADYLPAGSVAGKGFAARTEQPVKLYFQLNHIKASGYHLAIFYP
ncbi:DUF3426 domain-containing protein [Massilia sp. DWR3-1-1]|uniref:DUF3426 domain-containing protein n=1 Tax=Massilia sp. DWR3-1-1 TaxID=2804559 RepID=UPI003CEBEBF1